MYLASCKNFQNQIHAVWPSRRIYWLTHSRALHCTWCYYNYVYHAELCAAYINTGVCLSSYTDGSFTSLHMCKIFCYISRKQLHVLTLSICGRLYQPRIQICIPRLQQWFNLHNPARMLLFRCDSVNFSQLKSNRKVTNLITYLNGICNITSNGTFDMQQICILLHHFALIPTVDGVPYTVSIFAENSAGNGTKCNVTDFTDELSMLHYCMHANICLAIKCLQTVILHWLTRGSNNATSWLYCIVTLGSARAWCSAMIRMTCTWTMCSRIHHSVPRKQ